MWGGRGGGRGTREEVTEEGAPGGRRRGGGALGAHLGGEVEVDGLGLVDHIGEVLPPFHRGPRDDVRLRAQPVVQPVDALVLVVIVFGDRRLDQARVEQRPEQTVCRVDLRRVAEEEHIVRRTARDHRVRRRERLLDDRLVEVELRGEGGGGRVRWASGPRARAAQFDPRRPEAGRRSAWVGQRVATLRLARSRNEQRFGRGGERTSSSTIRALSQPRASAEFHAFTWARKQPASLPSGSGWARCTVTRSHKPSACICAVKIGTSFEPMTAMYSMHLTAGSSFPGAKVRLPLLSSAPAASASANGIGGGGGGGSDFCGAGEGTGDCSSDAVGRWCSGAGDGTGTSPWWRWPVGLAPAPPRHASSTSESNLRSTIGRRRRRRAPQLVCVPLLALFRASLF